MDRNDWTGGAKDLPKFIRDTVNRMRPKRRVDPRFQTQSQYVYGDNVPSGGGGVVDFTDLDDTPSAYTGEGGKTVAINAGETALEFTTANLIKVSVDDTTAKYLEDGLSAGRGIALTTQNPGGNENVNVECDADYTDISANDANTNVSGTELETLTDGSNADALHSHTLSTPGGADTQVQFNDGGSFAGDSGLVFEKTNDQLGIAGAVSGTVADKLMVHGDGYFDGNLRLSGMAVQETPIGVRMYLNGAQSNLVNTIWTKVNLDGETYDNGTIGDTTNHKVLPTVPGYYIVQAHVTFKNALANKVYYCAIYKNGALASWDWVHSGNVGTTYLSARRNDMIYCNGLTDYLELYARSDSGDNTVDLHNHTASTSLVVFCLVRNSV